MPITSAGVIFSKRIQLLFYANHPSSGVGLANGLFLDFCASKLSPDTGRLLKHPPAAVIGRNKITRIADFSYLHMPITTAAGGFTKRSNIFDFCCPEPSPDTLVKNQTFQGTPVTKRARPPVLAHWLR